MKTRALSFWALRTGLFNLHSCWEVAKCPSDVCSAWMKIRHIIWPSGGRRENLVLLGSKVVTLRSPSRGQNHGVGQTCQTSPGTQWAVVKVNLKIETGPHTQSGPCDAASTAWNVGPRFAASVNTMRFLKERNERTLDNNSNHCGQPSANGSPLSMAQQS